MWIFTETGFVSAVRHFSEKDKLVVRARDQKSLENLANSVGLDIISTPSNDYPYRVFVADSVFVCSGAELRPGPDGKAVRNYLRDCYRYTVFGGWKRLADLPKAAVAPPWVALTHVEAVVMRVLTSVRKTCSSTD
jgi:hypothetical protein